MFFKCWPSCDFKILLGFLLDDNGGRGQNGWGRGQNGWAWLLGKRTRKREVKVFPVSQSIFRILHLNSVHGFESRCGPYSVTVNACEIALH